MALKLLPIVFSGGSSGLRGAKYIARHPTHATKSVTIGPCGLRCTITRSKFS